jgi:hypothetical protein
LLEQLLLFLLLHQHQLLLHQLLQDHLLHLEWIYETVSAEIYG